MEDLSFYQQVVGILNSNPEITYMLTVCMLTYLIAYLCKVTKKRTRMIITLLVGILLIVAYVFLVPEVKLPTLIMGLFATTGFYKYLMKPVLEKIGLQYPHEEEDIDNDGLCDCEECKNKRKKE